MFFTGVRYRLTPNNALEVSYSLSYGNLFEAERTLTNAPALLRFERYSGSINYVRYLFRRQVFEPFVTAGLGGVETAFAGSNNYDLSFNVGIGTDIRFNERLALRLEARDYIAYLPSPLQGVSQDLAPSAGLVFSSRHSSSASSTFPQVGIFIEGGLSVVAGAPAGQPSGASPATASVIGSSFSNAGRVMAGFRVWFSYNNAIELSWSQSPNGYRLRPATQPQPLMGTPVGLTQSLHNIPANYVRGLPGTRLLRPFVTAGLGFARYAGVFQDIDRFTWNVGGGADIPLRKPVSLRVEFRDFVIGQPQLGGVVHDLAPTLGFAYRFD
jgi:opacity protein-like surface antigen